uniref:Hemerythrin HHE cation binding domain-containing protein n=1 Tax=Candidatus Kentrum sp. MB TaxID=2138164 RepID=A0A451BE33_9GAMM|nr:MAG: hypothetical protein BECKMB1821G_GA0114241_10588 [Candidatus Kentron sp. MB]VFK32795.1 MAG: hypothetical protein BECKMB1821I_GA0114274_103627 [Candidatus Kentron sp. MB]VFK76549.1 MAG: hypothetical protein BECKMB1821H_GA0114242_106214 [Candidatus Kentron sp. MB]
MITFDELNAQNHDITELSNVLLCLIAERPMCDTKTVCELFLQYFDRVERHLGVVDHLYPILLADRNQQANNAASNFMSGEREIKKIIVEYEKTWINKKKPELVIKSYERFLHDTQTLFHLILDRIQDETEHLYPLVRQIGFAENGA